MLFPLLFLSNTFVPLSPVKAGWLKVAATVNSTTYLCGAMPALLAHGPQPSRR